MRRQEHAAKRYVDHCRGSVEGGGGGYAVRIEDYKATAKWQVKEQQEEEEEKTTIQKLTTFNLGKP